MVELTRSDVLREEKQEKLLVKEEAVDDSLRAELGPPNKRCRSISSDNKSHERTSLPGCCNPLDEPNPLGLNLRKSPSLLDLIQLTLSKGTSSITGSQHPNAIKTELQKGNKAATVSGVPDKLKASNFPAIILRIGCWEYKSRYEGDLVAKCYYAKHKLVWEVLEGGLKNKIEIQWSDIMALSADFTSEGFGTLSVVLARRPLFFKETNPQPRKHTLWQATADFTNGQASLHRKHFLQCTQGLLNKHFEKLIQCDARLNFLSRQPETVLDSPYFEKSTPCLDDPEPPKTRGIHNTRAVASCSSEFRDISSPVGGSSSPEAGQGGSVVFTTQQITQESLSQSSGSCTPSGGLNTGVVSSEGREDPEEEKDSGLCPSMSVSDLVNHIGSRISEQMNPSECQNILSEIAHCLLSDSQISTPSDERRLIARVNSLCRLLQDPPDMDTDKTRFTKEGEERARFDLNITDDTQPEIHGDPHDESKHAPGIGRKDSFSDFLLDLPRIASLPKFLFNISENGESQTR